MSDGRPRTLSFRNEDEAIAELDRLRVGGYTKRGNWSLPMICWHVSMRGPLQPPASPTPTPEQAKRKAFIDLILTTGRPPTGFQAPPEITPSPDAKPFVSVGSTVDEESDVCIIEAMKVFNNIKAEIRGTIAKILCTDRQTVEFGQPLFLVKP